MDTFQGFVRDPNTLHKYLYANSDPVNFTDPSGNISLGSISTAMRISVQLGKRAVVNIGKSALRSFNRSIQKLGQRSKNGIKPKKKLDKSSRKKDEEAEDLDQFYVLLEAMSGAGEVEIPSAKLVDTPRLVAAWGEGRWVKMSHTRKLNRGKKVVRVHYFRNLDTLEGVEFKFKRRK